MNEKQLEKVLKSLANKRRLLILSFLKKKKEATVGETAEGIKLSFKATSKHLGILFNSEILEHEQRGPQIFYSISRDQPEPVKSILQILWLPNLIPLIRANGRMMFGVLN